MEKVILVDAEDNALEAIEKMEAHQRGLLHRAFSVFLFNHRGELLLQKRAKTKYHSAGLWTNTCCSHPQPGESTQAAAKRRLKEEMGIDASPSFAYKFIYKALLDNQLTEHELDHVYIGLYNGTPTINPEEVEAWEFVDVAWLKKDIQSDPGRYTFWLKHILGDPKFLASVSNYASAHA